jgi:hypothetical protein
MNRLLAIAILGIGCQDTVPRSEPVPEPTAASPFRAGGADGVARAAIASLPVKDWPCATRFKNLGGNVVTQRIEYERREPCIVPAILIANTLGGCPAKRVDGDIRYDAEGRVVYAWPSEYRWGKHGPIERIVSERPWRFGTLDGDLATASDDGPDEVVRFDAKGRVIAVDHVWRATSTSPLVIAASKRLEYEGSRIVRSRHKAGGEEAVTEVLYDCSALPPDAGSGSGSAR